MKKSNEKTAAEKSADVKNVANQAKTNPLSDKVVKSDKTKKDETKVPALDPEKEKAIKDAEKNVLESEKIYAEAKTKLAEAKNALRKLTGKGKKSSEPKGPGVISTIFTLVSGSGKKGISKKAILDKLIELFPERASEGMEKTINVQLPGRMSKEKKVSIVKLETDCFVIEK